MCRALPCCTYCVFLGVTVTVFYDKQGHPPCSSAMLVVSLKALAVAVLLPISLRLLQGPLIFHCTRLFLKENPPVGGVQRPKKTYVPSPSLFEPPPPLSIPSGGELSLGP